MDGNEQKPAIRFRGFTDSWEQRKLGDLYIERNERGDDSLQILSVSIHTGVSNGELDAENLGKFVRRSEDKSTYKHVYYGDLIFNMMRAWQGAIGVAKSEGMISPAYISAIPNNEVYPPFMNYLLRRKAAINQINNLSYGVTDFRKRLYWDSFVRVTCNLPSVDEQRCITDIFEKIDNLITLHQRKYDKLVNIKKSMLDKMFPREGANVPEIRFAGFTDPWKQYKLSDYALYRRGSFPQPYGKKEWYDGEGSMPFVQVIDVTENMRLADNTKQKISRLAQPMSVFVKKGQVLVTLQGSIGRVAVTQYDSFVDRTILIFEKYKTQTDIDFWAYIIKQKFVDEARVAPGGTIKTITKEALSDFDVLLPEYKEQVLIGQQLRKIDDCITLNERKLEMLVKLKKSMLERMFI